MFEFINGQPQISATLKRDCSDFKVDENLGFDLSGQGSHRWLHIQKTDISTTDAAKSLSKQLGISVNSIGYSGMKDRRSVSSQWFSVPENAWLEEGSEDLSSEALLVLESQKNSKKLKIGSHRSNSFQILLRNCQGEREKFESRLKSIRTRGVPNYFGNQRFGRDLSNIDQVKEMMERALETPDRNPKIAAKAGRFRRGMLLSAARSYLFNHLLSYRVQQDNWDQYVSGDVLNLNGTARFFGVAADEIWDPVLQQRLEDFDIHPCGALAGLKESKDKYGSWGEAADIEEVVFSQFEDLLQGLIQFNVLASQRALRFLPQDFKWNWENEDKAEPDLLLQFTLVKGCYATSLLRELCLFE